MDLLAAGLSSPKTTHGMGFQPWEWQAEVKGGCEQEVELAEGK